MKRVRCPKCDHFIIFDEKKYQDGQSLHFKCPNCSRQFGIRIGVTKLHQRQGDIDFEQQIRECPHGCIVVIENKFHFKQVIPLQMGCNVIGKYIKGGKKNCNIETSDPSMDHTHCIIEVTKMDDGRLQYLLSDGPSFTGTFVQNQILGNKEKRNLEDETVFTIGATSIILRFPQSST